MERPARSTRGRRVAVKAQEGDEEFWNQEFFADKDEEDKEFATNDQLEREEEDVVDEDFDIPEDEAADDGELEEKQLKREARTEKKKNVYKDPLKKKARPAASRPSGSSSEKPQPPPPPPPPPQQENVSPVAKDHDDSGDDGEYIDEDSDEDDLRPVKQKERSRGSSSHFAQHQSASTRKSKRSKVVQKSIERERYQALVGLERSSKTTKQRGPVEFKRMSQEELLAEAAATEISNKKSLQRLLQIEEERKKSAAPKAPSTGPRVIFKSKGGINTLSFTEVTEYPPEINAKEPPYPDHPVCCITGLPARYLHPAGFPFATIDAYKIIQERIIAREQEEKESKILELKATLEKKEQMRESVRTARTQ